MKYIIENADGSPVDPNAQYFVLRLDGDSPERAAARMAVMHFSEQVKPHNEVQSVAAFHMARKSDPTISVWRHDGYHGDNFLDKRKRVEEAFARGETIQSRSDLPEMDASEWADMAGNEMEVETRFAWEKWQYRVKPSTAVERTEWKCYHCGEVLTDDSCARAHFGAEERCLPACRIKAGAEGSLLRALRDAEEDAMKAWSMVHNEGTEAHLALASAHSRHHRELQSAEELGYERGLRDAQQLAVEASNGEC